MSALTVTAKGQITLRKEFLLHLGLGPGDAVVVSKLGSGALVLQAAATKGLESFVGCLPPPQRAALSVQEISALAAKGWAGER